ncbi:hypothetical protein KAFR_0C02180 [Kazachstania africana CBS 2517]|uniref:Uncharacterized protein n=1 Tax=Kazachstania africana (strain ATCC 22294 / BCRC 22015 / CBS 2517 / CECT 1963 / NBRC 1671 / NRRL Y-8276) TaxID=1071382 RepID=H2AS61_KAZAF|nr:hypothetical protein KAFR_0C02180 [Kazachstania africana CBS 2517]CCF57211.1 hypothetical protein KAFR_0C02180 [Kazachstania africana CBS 2517]
MLPGGKIITAALVTLSIVVVSVSFIRLKTDESLLSITTRKIPFFASPSASFSVKTSDSITWDNYKDFMEPIDLENSTAIFNSIYAALRQAGSDIHPLGVSYFPAVIPKGTLMYHAGAPEIPESFEWLAMDHEFSFTFGVRSQKYGRNATGGDKFPGFGPGKDGPSGNKPPGGLPGGGQRRGKNGPTGNRQSKNNFLTFRATKDLNRFLYLDGASAAKTSSGEMDTQKMLSDVINWKLGINDSDVDSYHMIERMYAARICEWGRPFGLDGIIRVEVGFEVVLCDFNNGATELVSNVNIPSPNSALGLPAPANVTKENGWPLDDNGKIIEEELTDEQRDIMDQEDFWQETLSQYTSMQGFDQIRAGFVHDKRDKRVELDYRYLITGINRTYINPDANNRRLLNDDMTWEKQLEIVNDLEEVISYGFDARKSIDWQQVEDEIVDKFAPMLKMMHKFLNSDSETEEGELSLSDIALQVTRYTLNFVLRFTTVESNDEESSSSLKTFGSGRQFAIFEYAKPLSVLETPSDYLIWSANVRVVEAIVDTIYDIHELLLPIVKNNLFDKEAEEGYEESAIESSRSKINALVKQLDWIAFDYKCDRACNWDEVCYTPSWGPSPLARMGDPNSSEDSKFGFHYDNERGRQVINKTLKCISADYLINNRK